MRRFIRAASRPICSSDQRYFTDPDEFWRLQNTAISAERDDLLAAGWHEVHIVAPDQRFQAWEFEKVPKSRGGAVYIDVEPDGSVTHSQGLAANRPQARQRVARCQATRPQPPPIHPSDRS